MKAHQLKNAILQLAVQGKLVPQNPNDEPASKLLERIAAEKQRRIKAGEIKKDKRDSTIVRRGASFYEISNTTERCIDDELPFDLPKGWEWITLTDIGFFTSGKTPASQLLEKSGIIPYFKVADMNTLGNEVYLHKTNSYLNNSTSIKLFQKGSIVFPKNGGAVFTNKKRILLQDSLVDLNTGCFTSLFPMDEKFLYYLFSTIDFKKHYKGTALPTVDLDSVKCLIWGLPPLAEQRRIVDRLESLLPLVEAYGKAEAELSELDARFPDMLKKSILQDAVQGKLVPQNPNDEPASKLLQRIAAEKRRRIKAGEIKKDKRDSTIVRRGASFYEIANTTERCIDDELPFDLPNGWEWARLAEPCDIINGFTPLKTNSNYWNNGTIPWFTVDDIHKQGRRIKATQKYITEQSLCKNSNRILPINTVLICCTASVGEYAITEIPLTTNQQFNGLVIKDEYKDLISPEFLYKLVQTFKSRLINIAGKTTINFVSVKKLGNLLIPIPPLAEQRRIVDRLESLFSTLSIR